MKLYNINIKLFPKAILATVISLMLVVTTSFAGSYQLENGRVSITFPAPVGQLMAVNQDVSGSIDPKTGAVNLNIAVGGFRFITPSMPDYINETTTKRFHEYYLETDKFPNATFKGKIADLKKVNFSKDGTYTVEAKGLITIHGTTQEISRRGTITVKGKQVTLKTDFVLTLNDYRIRVPEVLQNVFFKEVNVGLECRFKQ